MILNRFIKIIKNYIIFFLNKTVDHDIFKFNIMFIAECFFFDIDHQFDSNELEAAQHVFSHADGGGDIIGSNMTFMSSLKQASQ